MSRCMNFDAVLSLRDDVDIEEVYSAIAKSNLHFDECDFKQLDNALQISGVTPVNDPCGYLKEVQYALNDLRKYVCKGEDAYVIDLDAVWPAGWRFVFDEDGVKCYEGMMVFVEEVKL